MGATSDQVSKVGVQPVKAGSSRYSGFSYFDNVAVAEWGVQCSELAIYDRSNGVVPEFGVNAVGKVDRSRACWQILDVAFRRVDEYLILKNISADSSEVFLIT